MNSQDLYSNIRKKKSYLCVGLDSDLEKIPQHLKNYKHPVFEFNKQIIDATACYALAYKPNLAFYECRGSEGWRDLELTAEYIKTHYPDQFLIADAKRGDIGNTSAMYAKAFFNTMNFDAVTVAPYMGEDSVKPFLTYKEKFIIILALTSNPGASDFQYFTSDKDELLFSEGATKSSMLKSIRKQIPDHFLLVPGIGAQGGSLEEVSVAGLNKKCGLLVNSSRSIIFAGNEKDFAEKASAESKKLQRQMEKLLENSRLI